MKTIRLKNDHREALPDDLQGQFPDHSHVDLIITESTCLVARDGSDVAILRSEAAPPLLHKLAYNLWNTVSDLPSNRATAVGTRSLHRITGDGSLGKRRGVPKNVVSGLAEHGTAHGTIGYFHATPDHPCHRTPLTRKHPEMLNGNQRLIKLVDRIYKQDCPLSYMKQRAELEKVPEWRLWDTVFSTIYVALNFRTAYHVDRGNLRGVMTALLVMGNFTGGELVLPRWRVAFALKPGDLLIFDPQQIHGNLPFEGSRLSAAFFCARRIAMCGKKGR